jgi:hypothetical protein
MWMDIQSSCSTCEITARRGLQYAVILPEDLMSEVRSVAITACTHVIVEKVPRVHHVSTYHNNKC